MNRARLDTFAADGEERQREHRPSNRSQARVPYRCAVAPDIDGGGLFIQSTIVVTIATATSDAIPAMASAARPEIVFSPNWITRNTAIGHRDCCGDAQPHPLEGVAAV